MGLVVRKPFFAYAKTKTQISCAVTAQLITAFVFATHIVQSLYLLNPKFQASSYLLWLYSPVCGRPGRNPRRLVFSQRGPYHVCVSYKTLKQTHDFGSFLAQVNQTNSTIAFQVFFKKCILYETPFKWLKRILILCRAHAQFENLLNH